MAFKSLSALLKAVKVATKVTKKVASNPKKVVKTANKTAKKKTSGKSAAQTVKAMAKAAQSAEKAVAKAKAAKQKKLKAEKQKKLKAAQNLQRLSTNSLKNTRALREKQKKAATKKNTTWRDNLRADGKQAVAKAKQTDALGVKIKTKSYKADTGVNKSLFKATQYAKTLGDITSELDKKDYKNLTSAQKKQITKDAMKKATKEIDKAANKAYADKLKYRNLTSDEYLRLQTAERMPSVAAKNAALGKSLAKTVGSLNTAALKKSNKAQGVLEGLNPLPVELNRMSSGTYSEAEKAQNKKSKQTTGYKAGYMAGQVGSYFLGGGLGAGESGVAKAVLKKMGAKQGSGMLTFKSSR